MASVKEIRTSELRYRRLFEAAQDGIILLDAATGEITDVNPFLIRMLGYSREELMQQKLWEIEAFSDIEARQDAFFALREDEYIRYDDLLLRTKDGGLIDVDFVSNVYWVGDEKVIQCNIRDISERKRAEKALLKSEALLREQSVRDYLTGIFNRRYMEETLERELLRASRKEFSLGIIMVDVDNFKQFNDTYGHAAGDAILRELSYMLLEHIRTEDILSRYGGDEFIIILPDASQEVTLERAERIRKHAHHLKIQFEGKPLDEITISLGVVTFPINGTSTTTLLKAVDAVLYRAKHEGRNRIVAAG